MEINTADYFSELFNFIAHNVGKVMNENDFMDYLETKGYEIPEADDYEENSFEDYRD